jgi:ubiquinone/menaquinone biosynthesis C-methylase UbiE
MSVAMSTSAVSPKHPDYGIDAPPVIRNLFLLAGAALIAGLVFHVFELSAPFYIPLREIAVLMGLNFFVNAGCMLWYSKVAKLQRRELFLNQIPWRGDETVLDVGCGRGLLLTAAARRLKTGKAVGVDLWQKEDLSGNRPEATLENARLEGVADRVEVKDGDARQLQFADASFDVVISGLALHNIYNGEERAKAVREIARVLKPGGHVAIVDIEHTADYERILRESGVADVKRVPSGPWMTLLVTAGTWGGVRPYRVIGRKLQV